MGVFGGFAHGGTVSEAVSEVTRLTLVEVSELDGDTEAAPSADDSDYSLSWMAGVIGHHVHDPYALYEKAAT
jgi:hypothetical protein